MPHPNDTTKTYADVLAKTKAREASIRQYFDERNLKYQMITVWECEVNEQLKKSNHFMFDEEMYNYFESTDDTAPFESRSVLYGGIN